MTLAPGLKGTLSNVGVDAHEICENLWQGAAPPDGSYLASLGFKAAVFCAYEFQPEAYRYPGLKVVLAPNDDDYHRNITASELGLAVQASRVVATYLRHNQPVLVSCIAGRNRSGLVCALTLHHMTGMGGAKAIELVRMCRPNALTNPSFVSALEAIRQTHAGRR